MRSLFLAVVLCLSGCAMKQRYIEGTHLALGAYIPLDGGLYGVELVQYVNGAVLATATNTPCTYTRTFAATNAYLWGAVETRESTVSRLEITGR